MSEVTQRRPQSGDLVVLKIFRHIKQEERVVMVVGEEKGSYLSCTYWNGYKSEFVLQVFHVNQLRLFDEHQDSL